MMYETMGILGVGTCHGNHDIAASQCGGHATKSNAGNGGGTGVRDAKCRRRDNGNVWRVDLYCK